MLASSLFPSDATKQWRLQDFSLWDGSLSFCLSFPSFLGSRYSVSRFSNPSDISYLDLVLVPRVPVAGRLVALESRLGLESGLQSIFAVLGLGLGLGKICNQVHFRFSLCTFAVFC